MIKLTLSVSLLSFSLEKKNKFLSFPWLSLVDEEKKKKTDALSRERRVQFRSDQSFFFFFENERARNVQYSETRPRLAVNRAIRSISSRSARN